MTTIKDFHELLKSTEIMAQVVNSLEEEPLKLLKDICRKNEQSGQPVPDYNIPVQGYIGDVALKSLVQAGLLDKIDGGKIALYSYQPTGLGNEYCKKLSK